MNTTFLNFLKKNYNLLEKWDILESRKWSGQRNS